MKALRCLLLTVWLGTGCDTLKGPNQSYVAPAVEGRVVDAVSAQALSGARIQRYLSPPSQTTPLDQHGSEQLLLVPAVRSDAQGRFRIAPEQGGYLLLEHPGVLGFTLVARHSGHETLTTNIDLTKIKPVKTNNVPTVLLGDLPLDPRVGR